MVDSEKNVRLLFFLPSLQAYRDRANMVGQIALRVGKAVLLVGRLDVEPSKAGVEHMQVVEVQRKGKLDKLPLAASRIAARLIKYEKINVVHDTFGAFLPLLLRRKHFPETIFLSSFYRLPEWELRHLFWPRYPLLVFFRDKSLRQHVFNAVIQRAICRFVDCVVMQSPGLADRLVAQLGVPLNRVAWIPNSVAEFPGITCLQRGNNPGEPVRLLYVHGLAVTQGFDSLLNLLDFARSRDIPLVATAIGDFAAYDEQYLKTRIADLQLGNRLFLAPRVDRDQLFDRYFRVSDWLFHLSEADGSPRVVLEALAHGLPVIASNHPGITVMDPERQFIAFTEPHNLEHMLEIALSRITDPEAYQRRARLGTAYVAERFSSQAIAQRHVELYAELLNRHV